MVPVEVVYVPVEAVPFHRKISIASGSTVEAVLVQSGIERLHPETRNLAIGIFSKRVTRETRIKANDRIEIYRSLIVDPKDKRRQCAKMIDPK